MPSPRRRRRHNYQILRVTGICAEDKLIALDTALARSPPRWSGSWLHAAGSRHGHQAFGPGVARWRKPAIELLGRISWGCPGIAMDRAGILADHDLCRCQPAVAGRAIWLRGHSHRTVVPAGAVGPGVPHVWPFGRSGLRCAADLQYDARCGFVGRRIPGQGDPLERRVSLTGDSPEIDRRLYPAPPEADAPRDPSADGGEDQAAEAATEQDLSLVVPEPGCTIGPPVTAKVRRRPTTRWRPKRPPRPWTGHRRPG